MGIIGSSALDGGRTLNLLAGEAAGLVERLRQSVVWIQARHGHGSGLIWDSEGLIVTNDHVAGGERAWVELADGRRLSGIVVARDSRNDLAAVRVAAAGLPAAVIGDSTTLRVGALIVAVGHPFGVKGTATLGIVSRAPWREASAAERAGRRELVQADVYLAPGNSGGPLVNAAGEVIGIACMVLGPGIALAVPSHVVRRFIASLPGMREGFTSPRWERAA